MTKQAAVNMSNPLWEAASEIDDEIDDIRKLVDNAELYRDPDTFRLIRLRLSLVAEKAGDIMAMTRDHAEVETDYVIGVDLLPSRQETP